jgi:hypothetical protein
MDCGARHDHGAHWKRFPNLSHLQVEGWRNRGLLHLGGQGQARDGEQLCHPSLVLLKW